MALELCLPIVREKIRAEVYMGTTLLAKTPYVKNFNVRAARSQISATFNLTLELLGTTVFPTGEMLRIKAGIKGQLKTIFTGSIDSTQVRPVFGKPSYYSITLAGRGVLSVLENKKFSRRLKSDGQGMYCVITGGADNRPQNFKTIDKIIKAGNQTTISNTPKPAGGEGEHSPLVVSSTTAGGITGFGAMEAMATPMSSTGGPSEGTGDGLVPHTHEDMAQGGPAFAVYSAD